MAPTRIGRAETAVLLACARRRAQTSGDPAPIDADLKWDALLQAADTHGVTELLATPLTARPTKAPPEVVAQLERHAIEVTGQNLGRVPELVGLLQLLSSQGLRALAFKGLPLAAGVYGHLGRRYSSDIDLFIDRRDFPKVRALLLDRGYRVAPSPPNRCESVLTGWVPAAGRVEVLVPAGSWQTTLDVHVAFGIWTFGLQCDAQSLFDRAITVDVAGHAIPTLCPNDLLLVLAIHGTRHHWWPLRLVSDIDAVADLVDDWDDVLARADAAGLRRTLRAALLLSEHLLHTAVPPRVLADASADRAAKRVARWAAARMFVEQEPSPIWPGRPLLRCFVPDTLRGRLRFYLTGALYPFLKRPWNTGPLPRAGRHAPLPAYHSREGSR